MGRVPSAREAGGVPAVCEMEYHPRGITPSGAYRATFPVLTHEEGGHQYRI